MSNPDGPEETAEEPGHHIDVWNTSTLPNHHSDARMLGCECGWLVGEREPDVENAKLLHWLAKKIERETLG